MDRRSDINDTSTGHIVPDRRQGPEIWMHVQDEIRETIPQEEYAKWIGSLKFIAEVDGAILIAARDRLSYDRVYSDHWRAIVHAWHKYDPRKRQVRLECWSAASRDIRSLVDNPWAQIASVPQRQIQADMTFETLVIGPSNANAATLARRMAEGEAMPAPIALIYGPQGVGKTHILRALETRIRERVASVSIIYMTAEEFMARYHAGVMKRDTSDLKSVIRSAEYVLIDDLQWIAGKPGTDTEFFANIRAVAANGGKVVLTADAAPGDLKGFSPRMRGELKGAASVEVELPDQDMRREIVRVHAELLRKADSTFILNSEMQERIVRRVRGPGRNLCGTLLSLITETGFGQRELTLELIDRVILRQEGTDKVPTIDAIKRATMRYFDVSKSELESPCKAQAIVYPRQIAMYLCRELTSKSYPQIGRSFGKRDHTTVIYATSKISSLQPKDPEVEADIEGVTEILREMQATGEV